MNLGKGSTQLTPIKALINSDLDFGDYLDMILEESRSEEQRLRASQSVKHMDWPV